MDGHMPIIGHTLCVLIWSHPSPMSHGVSSVKQRSRGTNREVVFGLSLVRRDLQDLRIHWSAGLVGAVVFLAENSACANEMAGEFLGAKIFSVAWRPRRVVPSQLSIACRLI